MRSLLVSCLPRGGNRAEPTLHYFDQAFRSGGPDRCISHITHGSGRTVQSNREAAPLGQTRTALPMLKAQRKIETRSRVIKELDEAIAGLEEPPR